jgi:hypothetical protein
VLLQASTDDLFANMSLKLLLNHFLGNWYNLFSGKKNSGGRFFDSCIRDHATPEHTFCHTDSMGTIQILAFRQRGNRDARKCPTMDEKRGLTIRV